MIDRQRGLFFLFPGIFVYDNNPGAAADHVLAFFAAPALLAAMRAAETLQPRWWALFGITAAGAVLTKLQSAYFLMPPGLLMAAAQLCGDARLVHEQPLQFTVTGEALQHELEGERLHKPGGPLHLRRPDLGHAPTRDPLPQHVLADPLPRLHDPAISLHLAA